MGTSVTYLSQEVITPRRQCLVTVALQRASGQGDDDDWRLEQIHILELVLLVRLALDLWGCVGGRAEDTDGVDPL